MWAPNHIVTAQYSLYSLNSIFTADSIGAVALRIVTLFSHLGIYQHSVGICHLNFQCQNECGFEVLMAVNVIVMFYHLLW
jgi:hypothetical protein